MSRKRKGPSIPIGPNETGLDPQFGNVEDLPFGVKRQTSVIAQGGKRLTDPKKWARLVFSFPECLGIKQTLDIAAKKAKTCIPTVDMDVPINLPIIRDCKIDFIKRPMSHAQTFVHNASEKYIRTDVERNDMAFILTGKDQLVDTAPSLTDPEKKEKVKTAAQVASLSDAIYALLAGYPYMDSNIVYGKLNGSSWGDGWLYGETKDGIVGLTYAEAAARYLQPSINTTYPAVMYEVNNIQKKGFLLLKDHVNLFCRLPRDNLDTYDIRVILDYQTREVSLSSLLVWQQQLTEFIPKSVQWRVLKVVQSADKNGWNIAISRGEVKENGTGDDPTDKTAFPDIKD